MTDDGLNIGVLYSGTRAPYQPPIGRSEMPYTRLEKDFAL
jgi:hypothetical protein